MNASHTLPPQRSEAADMAADMAADYQRQVQARRRRALDILLAGALVCSLILMAMLAWIHLQPRPPLRDITFLTLAVPAMLAAIALTYALARWISVDVASVFLLIAGILIVTFSDRPGQLAVGPGLIAYAVPILAAGILLPAWSAFVVAGLSALAVVVTGAVAGNPVVAVPPTLILFMLALITWYFAHNLEQSNLALRDANIQLRQDIAERKEAEARLRLMSHVVEQSPVSIALMDQTGHMEYVNSQFYQIMGLAAADAAKLSWKDLQPPDAPPDVDAHIQAVLASGGQFRAQSRRQRANGEWFWESVSISLVHDADTGAMHYLAIAEDVTARHEAEDALRNINAELERRVDERTTALRRANVELEHSGRLKDEFMATMSHELRTPLTGVLGAADVLAEQFNGPLNPRQLRLVKAIQDSGLHLLSLINGILDLTKIEAGGMQIDKQLVEVDEACRNALTVVREQALQKKLILSFTSRPADMQVAADPIRLKQMLVNLLSNAVKFTSAGGRIGLDVEGDVGKEEIRFVVWDTGIGIAAENMPRLFQPFVQLDSGLNRTYGGTGLGLTLVRKFAELHDGGVEVESSPGEGSRFTIILPWKQADLTPTEAAAEPPADQDAQILTVGGRKPLILLAEDSKPSIETVLNFLEPLGCELLVVQRGDDAVRTAREQKPDLILMDIQMPHMDGLTAIRQIRISTDPAVAQTPIIALTALAMRGDRERCLSAGADEYLSKPFTMRALAEMIRTLLDTSNQNLK
jgi:PAS domain S-box-containing protein